MISRYLRQWSREMSSSRLHFLWWQDKRSQANNSRYQHNSTFLTFPISWLAIGLHISMPVGKNWRIWRDLVAELLKIGFRRALIGGRHPAASLIGRWGNCVSGCVTDWMYRNEMQWNAMKCNEMQWNEYGVNQWRQQSDSVRCAELSSADFGGHYRPKWATHIRCSFTIRWIPVGRTPHRPPWKKSKNWSIKLKR